MKNRDFLTKTQKHHLKYYRRHGTIKNKNELQIKFFQEKKKFLMIDRNLSKIRLPKGRIFSKKSIFPPKNHL